MVSGSKNAPQPGTPGSTRIREGVPPALVTSEVLPGGVAFGMRDFWKLHPTQIDIRNATQERAEVTLWLWSPDAQPMDLRFYHDGMGQDVEGPLPEVKAIDGIEPSVPETAYAKQLDALNITYEDYEPGFGTPYGVGRSTDLFFIACAATPSKEFLGNFASIVAHPPQLVVQPKDFLHAGVFSNMWGLPDRSTPVHTEIEDRLDWSGKLLLQPGGTTPLVRILGLWRFHAHVRFGSPCVEIRHRWIRLGITPNSPPTCGSGIRFCVAETRKAFRLAEAMNRHNRDVDIYHIGRFAGLGTRHNVLH